MTTVWIEGHPKATLEFFDIVTWNVFSNKHRLSKATIAAKFRRQGRELARDFMFWSDVELSGRFLVGRALIVVKVLPPREEVSDIPNVCLKHILDGFKDAAIYEDDEWAFVPLVVIMWAGIDTDVQWRKTKTGRRANKRRTIFEIHELAALVINGESQILPTGRRRL